MDIACKYNSEQEITAFAFRTHAHDLGKFEVFCTCGLGLAKVAAADLENTMEIQRSNG